MNYLSDEEIITTIKGYATHKTYDYAIMLDGEWGCGKTYFIKHKLIPAMEGWKIPSQGKQSNGEQIPPEKCKPIYISLYGLHSTNEISNQIFFLTFANGKLEKYKDTIPTVGKVLNNFIPKIDISNMGSGIKSIMKTFQHLHGYVFIFDDLERCSVPIPDVLGFINGLVEQSHLKVVIVANEKEIGKMSAQSNRELKYLVACDDRIVWPKPNHDNLGPLPPVSTYQQSGDKRQDGESVPISEIGKRASSLFGEDAYYKQVKEKLIGMTLAYHPDMGEAIQTIVSEYVENKEEKKVVADYRDEAISIMREHGHLNLRTFQFALMFFDRIFPLFPQCATKTREEAMQNVFVSILKETIYMKQGKKDKVARWGSNAPSEYKVMSHSTTWNSAD